MKKLILALTLSLVSCKPQKVESDNEVLKNLSSYDFVYIVRGFGDWTVTFDDWKSVKYYGRGGSLAEAYRDALKHKTMECEIK